MRGRRIVRGCALSVVCGVLASGCSRARLSQEPGLVTSWDRQRPAASAPAPIIALAVHPRHLEFDAPASAGLAKPWYKRKLRAQVEEVVGEFPFLANARWASSDDLTSEVPIEAPYRLVVEATHAVRGSGMRNKIASTVHFVIPSSDKGYVELEADVYRGAERLKTYEATGSYKTTRHLLFLLAPWMWRTGVPQATMRDTCRDLFLQIQRDASALFRAG
jgi:hypothetical protein